MKLNLRREIEGQIIKDTPDPYDPDQHAWIDVLVDNEVIRLLVTQRFRQEKQLYEGEQFSWKSWTIPLLNFLLMNPVQDITKDFPPEKY